MSNQNIVKQLKENAKNKNTLKATQTWLNVWQTWAKERKVNPKMEEYEHEQLGEMLQIFYTGIRTKDGSEYEPESLKSMLAALNRYLKEHGYKYSIIRNREFHQLKLVLEGKVGCLRQQGKGKRPNAANALTTEEEEMLWSEQSCHSYGVNKVYLAIIENPKTNVWYKKQRLGVNSIDNMMKSVVKNTPLEKSKKEID